MYRPEINSFSDFRDALRYAGFSTGGGNADGVFAIIPFLWTELPPYRTRIRWHTGNPDTDPWEWRIRVLDECDDIAYAKMFFGKSGYITREWYPYFLAARRDWRNLADSYSDGRVSRDAKRIFEVISERGALPVREIKRLGGFSREDKSRFDRAVIELQNGLFITMCGHSRQVSGSGEEYGWSEMLYCTTETFWGGELFERAGELTQTEAARAIEERVLSLNPDVDAKKLKRFIFG
ncbi:MAG: hypothetical protein LBN99_08625 [Oscillospiraceae bacterium]|nr:hypothetical protein [Oscillospiraceae bacterium]